MTISNFFEKMDFLWDKDIVKWRIRSRGLSWHVTWILLKGNDLNQKLKIVQVGRHDEQTCLTQTYHKLEYGGASHWPILCNFGGKNSYFDTIWIIFLTFLEPFEMAKFLTFESQFEKSNW